jgi:hypothetical protein
MRKPATKSALAAAIMADSLPGSDVALADGRRYHADHRDYGHLRWHYRESRYGGHHDRGYYFRDHHGSHVTNFYEYDDDDTDKLLIGPAPGSLPGYAINHAVYE